MPDQLGYATIKIGLLCFFIFLRGVFHKATYQMVLVNLITNLSVGGSLTAKSMLTPQMVGVVGLEPTRPEGH